MFLKELARFEQPTRSDLSQLVASLMKLEGEDTDIKETFENWMSTLLTGKTAAEDDWRLIWDFVEACDGVMYPGWGMLLSTFLFLRHLLGKPGELYT